MTKGKSFLFWFLAFLITASSAIYQRMTGPTYPIDGKTSINNNQITYKFLRSYSIKQDCPVEIKAGEANITGTLHWRRYKFDKEFNQIEMTGTETLRAELPKQPPAGKLEYFVTLKSNNEEIKLPYKKNVVIRFKGDVPTWILIPHVIAMFASMLFAARAGFEYFSSNPKLKFYSLWTIGILFIGGFILGPIMQKYAFGEFWTGFPFGYDLTDNKTLIAMIGWFVSYYRMNKSQHPKRWLLFAAIIMFIVYLIPHSVLGSELDYSTLE